MSLKKTVRRKKYAKRMAACMTFLALGVFAGCNVIPLSEGNSSEISNPRVMEVLSPGEDGAVSEIEKTETTEGKTAGKENAGKQPGNTGQKESEIVAEKKEEQPGKDEHERKEESERKEVQVREEESVRKEEQTMAAEQVVYEVPNGVITGTFSRTEGGVTEYPAYFTAEGEQYLISLDLYATNPSWQGFEKDVLHMVGLEDAKYIVTNAAWTGEPYWGCEVNPETNEVVAVEYRDAVYSYEAR